MPANLFISSGADLRLAVIAAILGSIIKRVKLEVLVSSSIKFAFKKTLAPAPNPLFGLIINVSGEPFSLTGVTHV